MTDQTKLSNALKIFELLVTNKSDILPVEGISHISLLQDCLAFVENPTQEGLKVISAQKLG